MRLGLRFRLRVAAVVLMCNGLSAVALSVGPGGWRAVILAAGGVAQVWLGVSVWQAVRHIHRAPPPPLLREGAKDWKSPDRGEGEEQ